MLKALQTARHIQFNHLDTAGRSSFYGLAVTTKNVCKVIFTKSFGLSARKKVECNICKWTGNHFVDFYTGYGHVYKNSVCPECFSHPRHRSYVEYLKHLFGASKELLKVLHFSPERSISEFINSYEHIDYLSVDIDYRKAMRKEDITNLSFKDNSFDFIVCIHVFEHIDNDKQAMAEVYRVLKPGGRALLDVPIDIDRGDTYEDPSIQSPEARTKAYWQWDHVRLYGRDYPDKLAKAGFIVKEDCYLASLGNEFAKKHGFEINPSYLCTKKLVNRL